MMQDGARPQTNQGTGGIQPQMLQNQDASNTSRVVASIPTTTVEFQSSIDFRSAFWHTTVCIIHSSWTYQCTPLRPIHLCW